MRKSYNNSNITLTYYDFNIWILGSDKVSFIE